MSGWPFSPTLCQPRSITWLRSLTGRTTKASLTCLVPRCSSTWPLFGSSLGVLATWQSRARRASHKAASKSEHCQRGKGRSYKSLTACPQKLHRVTSTASYRPKLTTRPAETQSMGSRPHFSKGGEAKNLPRGIFNPPQKPFQILSAYT